jgi:hypothetical protein
MDCIIKRVKGVYRQVYQFKDCNFDKLSYHYLQSDLENMILNEGNDIDDKWELWKDEVIKVLNRIVPKKKVLIKRNNPWIDAEVIHASNVKSTLWRKAKKSGKESDLNKYKKVNNDLKKLCNKKYQDYINDTFLDMNEDPKKFWGMVNCKSKKSRIPDGMVYGSKVSTNTSEKIEMFNDYFYKSFNDKNYELPTVHNKVHPDLGQLTLEIVDVQKAMENVNINKAVGHDGIPNVVLRNCAKYLAPSLTLLFNYSLDKGVIPKDWKRANIVPIFKNGDKNNVENYRPVSLLCVIGKIMERCIHNHIFYKTKELLYVNQFGFFPGRSTTSQLLKFYEIIHSNLDNNIQTDVLYLDFSKAFDCVPHSLLVHKLKTFGFHGRLYLWFEEYLRNREQRVVIDGLESKYKTVLSGVPQGSILGPLLFLYFINDIYCEISENCHIYLYADDSKIMSTINNYEDCLIFQEQIDKLYSWSKLWGMKFNPLKCKHMSFTRKRSDFYMVYKLNDCEILKVASFNDLGVIVCDNLNWSIHVNNCIRKANQRLGIVKRTIGFNVSPDLKLMVYKALVRPLLEYASVIWSQPYNKKLIKKIESVQRRATKYILNNYALNYAGRLKACSLLPLTYRREFLDCIFFYNYLNGFINTDLGNFVELYDQHGINTRYRSGTNLKVKGLKTECLRNFFSYRIVVLWNSLPEEIKSIELNTSGTNQGFKKALKAFYLNKMVNEFEDEDTCTWVTGCRCNLCRS